jgi:16S rRNA (cytidine1402-2'-O)-methyltransferase
MPPGTLYIVATPIGNLDDVTLRALRVLKEAAVVACEDTRTTKKLLDRHGIATPRLSFHEHSAPARVEELVARLTRGDSVALVSEAGTPGLSDPGAPLLRAAIAANVPVVPVPGPAAFVAALSASGLPMARVAFEGFLPAKPGERRSRLAALVKETRTLAFYEAPHRIRETLVDLSAILGAARRACVAREVTKAHEEFDRGSLGDLAVRWASREPKGEFTVLVEGAPEGPREVSDMDVLEALREALNRGLSVSAATKEVTEALGAPRNRVYALALSLDGGAR